MSQSRTPAGCQMGVGNAGFTPNNMAIFVKTLAPYPKIAGQWMFIPPNVGIVVIYPQYMENLNVNLENS